MPKSVKVVAILVSTPALGSILGAVLAAVPTLRVRTFESQAALVTYMRLAPVDLIVGDFDGDTPANLLIGSLRADPHLVRRDVQVIALASAVTGEVRNASLKAGIDEVVIKPMSPRYLLERVMSRLERRAAQQARKPQPTSWPANVVPLFGRQPQPQH